MLKGKSCNKNGRTKYLSNSPSIFFVEGSKRTSRERVSFSHGCETEQGNSLEWIGALLYVEEEGGTRHRKNNGLTLDCLLTRQFVFCSSSFG